MPDTDFETLPLRHAYTFLEAHGREADAEEIRRSRERLGSYTTTLKRARIAALLQRDGLLDEFVAKHWPNGATPKGKQLVERFARIYERYESADDVDKDEPEIEEPADSGFVREEHEPGLRLWPVGPDADAVEFAVDGRRIDILAQDNHGTPVVIELKVSRGHEKTIGQCLYYRAKARELLNLDTVRIFIVAQEMSNELKMATRELKDVALFEYSISMNVKRL